tara:strand:- start:49 stop:444 length:396 start_codon:yes stop_codon:yes gene_type:complete
MTKLKTLLLLVLAGFILVACGSNEEAVEAEVVDPRADDKAALASMVVDQGVVLNSSIADCVVNVMSENLDDDAWKLLTFFSKMESDGNFSEEAFEEIEEFIVENDIDEDAIDEAIEAAAAKAEIKCDVDLD